MKGKNILLIIAVVGLYFITLSPLASNLDKSPTIDCYGLSDSDTIVSANPCLQPPYTMDTSNSIVQAVPDGWQIENVLKNADDYKDEWSEYARITANGFGLTLRPHNNVDGIDGHWGYSQNVDLPPGCYLTKVSGQNGINDPILGNVLNYGMSVYVDDVLLSQQVLPFLSGFELIYPFNVEVAGEYNIKWMIDVGWGTPGSNSIIDLHSAAVLVVDGSYCE